MKPNKFFLAIPLVGLLLSFSAFGDLKVGSTAPCVVLPGENSEGNFVEKCIREQEAESQSYTILEFFSIKCSDCAKNLPLISKLAKNVRDKATVRLVSGDSDAEEAKAWVAQKRQQGVIHFPVAYDSQKSAASAYEVFLTPTLYVLDKLNTVLYAHRGILGAQDIAQITEIVSKDPAPIALEVGDTAPCVVLPGIDAEGNAVEGCIRDTEQEEQTHTIIKFFSINCATCLKSIFKMSQLAEELSDSTTVRLVATNSDVDAVKAFVEEAREFGLLKLPVAFDSQQAAQKAYGVNKAPMLFALDRENTVVFKHGGKIESNDLSDLKEALADKPQIGTKIGDTAPCVVLDGQASDGSEVTRCIRDQEKQTQSFTLIGFHSMFCGTCNEDLEIYTELNRAMGDKLTLRSVFINRNESKVREFVAEKRQQGIINYPVAFDTQNAAIKAYELQMAPSYFLIDNDFKIHLKHGGGLTAGVLAEIKRIVKAAQ